MYTHVKANGSFHKSFYWLITLCTICEYKFEILMVEMWNWGDISMGKNSYFASLRIPQILSTYLKFKCDKYICNLSIEGKTGESWELIDQQF